MDTVLRLLLPLALFATFAILVLGVVSMIKGDAFNAKYGNKLMRARIVIQVVAVALLAAFFLIGRR